MARLAVIPARAGSKRIPKKNIREFFGKPLIAWSIEQALKSSLFDSVVVSTDSTEIANIAKDWGAEVPFLRPITLSDDFTGTESVIFHALNWFEKLHALPDKICCINATAPFITADIIKQCLVTMETTNSDSAMTVASYPYPIWRALNKDKEGKLQFQWSEYEESRSQDLPEVFHDAGQCYWVNVESFMKHPRFITDSTVCLHLNRWEVQDIDTEEDWTMAERLFRLRELGS